MGVVIMNLHGQEVVFLALILPLLPILALKTTLMNYVEESKKVLNCEDMCPDDETFLPAIANSADGSCPSDTKEIDFSKPLNLTQICEVDMLPTMECELRSDKA